MKILITGGSGFIGTHLIESLLIKNDDLKIVNIDLKPSSIKDDRLFNVISDIRSTELVTKLDKNEGFNLCIHLAALCKEPGFKWDEYFETNHLGTVKTIRLCEQVGISKIIFTSTMMVYQAGEVQRNESSITAPDTAYGISKLLGEKELATWKSKNELNQFKVIRPAVVFGPHENANFTRLYTSLKKGFFPYVGKSSTIKSNIYVKELVRFIEFLQVSETKENIYNFSFPERSELKDIISNFKRVFDFKPLTPVLPFKLLLLVSYGFELLNSLGLKNGIHHRRIEKLFHSTDITPSNALKEGYKFHYDLESSLRDWEKSGTLPL